MSTVYDVANVVEMSRVCDCSCLQIFADLIIFRSRCVRCSFMRLQ
jgi:hypothetical protein